MEKSRKGHTEDSEVGTVSCTVPPLKTGTLQQKQQQSRWPLPNLAPNTSHLEQLHGFAPCKGKKSTTSFRKPQPSHALPKTSTKFTNLFSQMNLPCQSSGWEAEREREGQLQSKKRHPFSLGHAALSGLLFIRTASLLPEKPWSRKSETVRSLPVGNCICEKEASHSCLTAHWHVNTAWFPAPDNGVCDAEDSSTHKHLNLVVSKETRGLMQFTLLSSLIFISPKFCPSPKSYPTPVFPVFVFGGMPHGSSMPSLS